MARVLVTRPVPPGGLDPLRAAGHDVDQRDGRWQDTLGDADAVLCQLVDRFGPAEFDAASRLRVIATASAGYDHIDLAAAHARGVAVVHTPGVLDQATADAVFGLMLAAARRFGEAERDLRAGRWQGWAIDGYLGQDVYGANLGLVGYGRIGRAVADRAAGFGMTVRHHSRHDTGVAGWTADLDELLAWADIVSLHVPLTESTRHLIGPRELGLLKPTAILVNTSRGPVVDELALADALLGRRIFAAGLDVYEDEPWISPRLLTAPGSVLLPHIGSATVTARTRMAQLAAEGVVEVLAGRQPATAVPQPQLS